MKKKIFFIIIILTLTSTKAQNKTSFDNINSLPKEQIFIHYNSNFLLTGEVLYYKIYCLNKVQKTASTYSKVAYLELINSKNERIIKQKINLKNGSGYGDFFINTSIKTGSYKLISYTQWMRNKQNFYEEDIFIVNTFSQKLNKANSDLQKNINKKELDILLKDNIGTYSKREKISINLSEITKHTIKNLSVSIRKKEKFNFSKKNNSKTILNSTNKETNSFNFYLPELRGTLIKGKLFSKKRQRKISNIKLALSIKGNNNITKTSITNKLGEFYFNIRDLRASSIVVQLLNENFEDYEIKLINKENLEKKFTNFKEIYLNDAISKIIKERNLHLQIENAYYSTKKDTLFNLNKEDSLFNFLKKTYKLDEYKRFKTVEETFIEIIKDVWITKNKENYKIHVSIPNPNKTRNYSPSLLIIDGHIVYNHNDFIDFDMKRIDSISIVKNKYFYGNNIYRGVIIVRTFKNDYTPNAKEYKILKSQPDKKYFFQEHSINNKRIPDYRTQIYWNPNVNTKELTFYSSDVIGDFQIEIEGFTYQGAPISIKKYFSVK